MQAVRRIVPARLSAAAMGTRGWATPVRAMGGAGRVVADGAGPKRKPRRRMLPAALEITPRAAEQIKSILENKPDALGVRVGVRTRGCNGLSYTMNYADERKPSDDEVDAHGVKVLIDNNALLHIVGTTMDYVEDELAEEFVFHNPNAKGTCGCGESFNV